MDLQQYEIEAKVEATHWWYVGRRKLFRMIINNLDAGRSGKVLDVGTSTGGNVATAIKLGRRLGPDATVVTVRCDSGVKYLSTALYRDGLKAAKEWAERQRPPAGSVV